MHKRSPKLRRWPGLAPRSRTPHGCGPEANVAQRPSCFASGRARLADAGRLNAEPLARQLARVKAFADQTTLGELWLVQTPGRITAFGGLVREFIQWGIGRAEF